MSEGRGPPSSRGGGIVESLPRGHYVDRADQQVTLPPHNWQNATFQGFILKADEKRLQEQCDRLLNQPLGEQRYRVKRPWVVLYFWSVGAWHSATLNMGPTTRDHGFYVKKRAGLWIPIERTGDSPGSRLHFLPVYEFINENVARSSGRETVGHPFDLAKIKMPVMSAQGFGKDFRFFGAGKELSVRTHVLDRNRPDRLVQGVELINLTPATSVHSSEESQLLEEKEAWLEELARSLGAAGGDGKSFPLQMEISLLKQYRDTSDARFACYQSVVDYQMQGLVSGAGWLPTKYGLYIKKVASADIVHSLGLDESQFMALDSFVLSAAQVRSELGKEYVPARQPKHIRYIKPDDAQVWPAPFELGNSSFYGFVLPAKQELLQRTLDKVFNHPTGGEVTYRAFIPAVLFYFANMRRAVADAAHSRTLGIIHEKEAGIWIPMVRVEKGKASYFCVYAYNIFVDSGIADTTGREVYGLYKEIAKIKVPSDPSRGVFELRPTVIERFDYRTRADWEILARMNPEMGSFSLGTLKQVPLDASYFLKGIGKLASERVGLTPRFLLQFILSLRNPRFAFLKQFRHAAVPGRSCYQAVVEADFTIQRLRKLGLLPGSYSLNVNEYASHPWLTELGLQQNSFNDLSGFMLDMDFKFQPGKVIWGG
jgi:hypothetical protein